MKNILIVDDEPDIRAILRYNLEKEGFSITEAVDGNDALDKLSKVLPKVDPELVHRRLYGKVR